MKENFFKYIHQLTKALIAFRMKRLGKIDNIPQMSRLISRRPEFIFHRNVVLSDLKLQNPTSKADVIKTFS